MGMQPVPSMEATPTKSSAHAGGNMDDEEKLIRHIVEAIGICVPLFVGLWIGLIALAVTIAGVGYAAPLLMGIAVGTLSGVFFGSWIGFVLYSREVD